MRFELKDRLHGRWDSIGVLLRRRLLAFLLLIGATALGGYTTFLLVVVEGAELGGLINVVGRQRMLSHRVAISVLQVRDGMASGETVAAAIAANLDAMDIAFARLDDALAGGLRLPAEADHVAREALRAHYVSLKDNAHRVALEAGLLTNLAALAAGDEVARLVAGPFTEELETVIGALERASRQRHDQIRLYAVVATGGFMVVLTLLGARLLWPLSRDVEGVVLHLAELETFQRAVVDRLPNGLLVLDGADGVVEQMNDEAERIFGWSRDDRPRLTDLLPVPPRLEEDVRARVAGLSRGGRDLHLDVRVRVAGRRHILIVADVTAEVEARADVAALYDVLESLPVCVVITDCDGRIEFVNARFSEVTGYPREEAVGSTPALLKSGRTPAATYRDLWQSLAAGRQWRGEILNRRSNGELFWQYEAITPLRDGRGRISRYFVIGEDVTPLKETEERLRAALINAQEASRVKSNFLASMSHELRTPLNAIIGYSELMQMQINGTLSPGHRDYVESILFSGRHLLDLINDLLDLSKIEAGHMELHEETAELADIIDTAVSLVRELSSRAGVPVRTLMPAEGPRLRVDVLRLRQVLINLLTNAIKYSEPGFAVTIAVTLDAAGVAMAVEDRGSGIAEEDLERVLQPFGQARNALVREKEGTGLGLPICRRLVELHGGSLDIHSRLGVGTRVTVRLPADRVAAAPVAVPLGVSGG